MPASEFCFGWTPVEAAGDHEVEDQPEMVIEAEGDALADAAELVDGTSFGGGERWLDGAEEERAGEADALKSTADYARFERVDVGGDVGELRHGVRLQGTEWFCNRRTDFTTESSEVPQRTRIRSCG